MNASDEQSSYYCLTRSTKTTRLAFIHANAEKLLGPKCNHCPRWFALVFPAMVELAEVNGLNVLFPSELREAVANIFQERQRILETERLVDEYQFPPLLSYLETLPATYNIDQYEMVGSLCKEGSLFQSPSATACAFMVTGNKKCLDHLHSLVRRCSNGVPAFCSMDEELMKLCMVNQLQRLGVAEHFAEEIEEILGWAYSNYIKQLPAQASFKPAQIYKDSLAFRLLRMHGYSISPWRFCWFLHHQDIMINMENSWESFSSLMFNVYRATDLMFSEEYELDEAKLFSRKLLEKTLSLRRTEDDLVLATNFIKVIKHELSIPWMARLDHLDHRMWIEENEMHTLWMGKASFYRWSRDCGLSDLGFGREKTLYCYFAAAASSTLPPTSAARVAIAKSAIIITVADDFHDMEGSIAELISLTEAIQRWDGKGLSGPSKIIFDTLDNFVGDIGTLHLRQQGSDITRHLRHIWTETFQSWLVEASWSKSQHRPSIDEYLETGMKSVGAHTMVLSVCCFLDPSLPGCKLKHAQYEPATKLLMMICRLLNDIQGCQEEQEDGKINSILLYLEENPEADIEDSISRAREIVDKKNKEFIEHVLMEGLSNLPNPHKQLHLACLKTFQMFYNSSNMFNSKTKLLPDIQKAIYIPIQVPELQRPKRPQLPSELTNYYSIVGSCFNQTFKHRGRSFVRNSAPQAIPRKFLGKMFIPPKFKLCF